MNTNYSVVNLSCNKDNLFLLNRVSPHHDVFDITHPNTMYEPDLPFGSPGVTSQLPSYHPAKTSFPRVCTSVALRKHISRNTSEYGLSVAVNRVARYLYKQFMLL